MQWNQSISKFRNFSLWEKEMSFLSPRRPEPAGVLRFTLLLAVNNFTRTWNNNLTAYICLALDNCQGWLLQGKGIAPILQGEAHSRHLWPTLMPCYYDKKRTIRSTMSGTSILGDFDSVIKNCGVCGTPGRGVRSRTVSPPPTKPTLLREESTHREEAQSHILLFVVFFIIFVCCVNCKIFMKKRGKIEAVYK